MNAQQPVARSFALSATDLCSDCHPKRLPWWWSTTRCHTAGGRQPDVALDRVCFRCVLAGTFNAWFILGPGVFATPGENANTIDAISDVRGEVGYQFMLFGQVLWRCARGVSKLVLMIALGPDCTTRGVPRSRSQRAF